MNVLQESARVIRTERITERLWWSELEAPGVASSARPGQFAHVLCAERSSLDPLLRRPLSFSRVNATTGQIAFLIDAVGRGTDWLVHQTPGTEVDLIGPLGTWFEWQPGAENALLIGGGIGLAPLLVLADTAGDNGVNAQVLCGARDAQGLTPPPWIADTVTYVVATDDGSRGYSGHVTDLVADRWAWADQVFACGPTAMLATMSHVISTLSTQIGRRPSFASLEARMGCAMGVCYSCVVRTSCGVKRVCKEGPVLPHDIISWDWTHD